MSDEVCIHEMMVGYCSICNKKDERKVAQKRAGYGRAGDSSTVSRLRRGTSSLGKIAEFESTCLVCDQGIFEGNRISYNADADDWIHYWCL